MMYTASSVFQRLRRRGPGAISHAPGSSLDLHAMETELKGLFARVRLSENRESGRDREESAFGALEQSLSLQGARREPAHTLPSARQEGRVFAGSAGTHAFQ